MIRALTFSHEHDFKVLPLGVLIKELSKFFVNNITFDRNVDVLVVLKIQDLSLQTVDLELCLLQLLEDFNGGLVGEIELLLKRDNEVRLS